MCFLATYDRKGAGAVISAEGGTAGSGAGREAGREMVKYTGIEKITLIEHGLYG